MLSTHRDRGAPAPCGPSWHGRTKWYAPPLGTSHLAAAPHPPAAGRHAREPPRTVRGYGSAEGVDEATMRVGAAALRCVDGAQRTRGTRASPSSPGRCSAGGEHTLSPRTCNAGDGRRTLASTEPWAERHPRRGAACTTCGSDCSVEQAGRRPGVMQVAASGHIAPGAWTRRRARRWLARRLQATWGLTSGH